MVIFRLVNRIEKITVINIINESHHYALTNFLYKNIFN